MTGPRHPDDEIMAVTAVDRETAGYPCLAALGQEVFVAFQTVENAHDRVAATRVDPGAARERTGLSRPGRLAASPVLFVAEGTLWAAWCELDAHRADLLASRRDAGTWSEPRRLASAEGIEGLCAVADVDGRTTLLWTEHSGTLSSVWAVDPGRPHATAQRVAADHAHRPSGALAPDGTLWVAYDGLIAGRYRAVVRARRHDGFGDPFVLEQPDDGWATSPVAVAGEGADVDVFWYTINRGASLHFWHQRLGLGPDGAVRAEGGPALWAQGRNWYAGLRARPSPNGRGGQLVYNWGRQIHLRRVADGVLGPPAVVSRRGGDDFNRRADVLQRDDGTVYVAFQHAPGNGHHPRRADVVVRRLTPQQLSDLVDPACESAQDPFVEPPERQRSVIALPPAAVWEFRGGDDAYAGLHLLWGDIHGQNALSDALGEMDQYYHAASLLARLDFVALTNHDVFPDELTPAEWATSVRYARVFNHPGELITLQALEWTSNEYMEDFGHKNIYFPDDHPRLHLSTRAASETPERLFAGLRQEGALCFPHHPAADWGVVSAATDWRYHDEVVQRAVEIFSRHAPFEYHGNVSPYTRNVAQFTGRSVRDALALGYRLSFTGGSDTHQLEHGLEGGLVAAYAEQFTREGVFDALAKGRIYATTGARILLELRQGPTLMGAHAVWAEPDAPRFTLRVHGTAPIQRIELIRDGQVAWSLEPAGLKVATDATAPAPGPGRTAYYYLRVVQSDAHMAWSSPIWLTGAPAGAL